MFALHYGLVVSFPPKDQEREWEEVAVGFVFPGPCPSPQVMPVGPDPPFS